MNPTEKTPLMIERGKELRLRQLISLLVVVLTFEGIARKAFPTLSVWLFLLKDFIVTIMALYVVRMPAAPALSALWRAYKILAVLFVPPFLCTAWNDWVVGDHLLLAVFGAKQYLLFPMVGFATFYAFHRVKMEEILRFFRWASLLIIPTAALAFVQLRLPHDHWLNMAVTGTSLSAFAAAGELRVSSSFSFVAQYCAFLNAQVFMLMLALHEWRKRSLIWKALLFSLVPLFVMSSFITGSRGAVVGNTVIILVAGVLVLCRFEFGKALKIVAVAVLLLLTVRVVQHFVPQTMAAYSEREEGHLIGLSAEVKQRVYDSFFVPVKDKSMRTFFGNGLGVMSNGSDTFSPYAAVWRNYMWTETDFSSTLFEGGIYLAVIWYGFRLYVIGLTTRRFLREISGEFSVPTAFTQGFVIVIGVTGTLAIQPPIAIWWWLAVGMVLVLSWKCISPPEPEIEIEPDLPPPRKLFRGRSLYAEVLHSPREKPGVEGAPRDKSGRDQ